MNGFDILVIAILLVMVVIGFSRGFVRTLYTFLSFIVTFALTYYFYPYVTRFLMTSTSLYTTLSEKISETLNLSDLMNNMMGREDQVNAIATLSLPEQMKDMLVANNNSEMFRLLGASSFEDYISGMLATWVINLISFIGLFLLISLILSIVFGLIDLVSKLPLINITNKAAGGLLGAIFAIGIIWIVMMGISMMITSGSQPEWLTQMDASSIAKVFYYNNPLLEWVGNIESESRFWQELAAKVSGN